MMLRPFLVTCDKRISTVRRFVQSYQRVKHSMLPPIVYYDGESLEYLRLLKALDPEVMIEQRKDIGLQRKMCFEMPRICTEMFPDDQIIFLEDDIIFSSKFPAAVNLTEKKMKRWKQVHIVTMYGSGDCYWPPKDNANFLYKFSGKDFYGNLCLIFSPKLMQWWYKHRQTIWDLPVGGWDIKIGQGFEKFGFNWYCTRKHYVQHQVGQSAISGKRKEQQSRLFIP